MINYNDISNIAKDFELTINTSDLKQKSYKIFDYLMNNKKSEKTACITMGYFIHYLSERKQSILLNHICSFNKLNIDNNIININQQLLSSSVFKKQKDGIFNIINNFNDNKINNVVLFGNMIYLTPLENQSSVLRFSENLLKKHFENKNRIKIKP